MVITDVLPLKAARRDAIANLKSFGGSRTPAIKFRRFRLHALCGATLFGWHKRHLRHSVWRNL